MGSDQQFCLQWHNYQSSLLASLPQLLDNDDLTDVTLSAGGHNIKAHRVILSACSQYFRDLFKVLPPVQHPVIILPGTNFADLCALITFMYSGEVNIYQEQLQGILSMADAMQIRGLAEVSNNDLQPKKNMPYPSKRVRLSQPSVSSPILNQALNENSLNCGLRPLPTEAVDISGNLVVKTDLDEYSDINQSVSCSRKNTTEDIHFSNGNRSNNFKTKHGNEDNFAEGKRNDPGRSGLQTDLIHFVDDISFSTSTPSVLGSPGISEEPQVKTIQDTEYLSSTGDGTRRQMTENADKPNTSPVDVRIQQDQQSPFSDDSASSNFGMEVVPDKVHHQSAHLSNMKFSASHYSKLATVPSSKLFATCIVCGKQLSNQYNLRVHMETHQNVNYACRVCNHVSRSRDALRKHVSYRHPKENKVGSTNGSNSKERRMLVASGNSLSGSPKKNKIFTTNNIKQEQP